MTSTCWSMVIACSYVRLSEVKQLSVFTRLCTTVAFTFLAQKIAFHVSCHIFGHDDATPLLLTCAKKPRFTNGCTYMLASKISCTKGHPFAQASVVEVA